MRTAQKWCALVALMVIAANLLPAESANAGCWNCEHIGFDWVCVGTAQGEGAYDSCGPQSDPEFGYCKTTGGWFGCSPGGGPGGGWCDFCYRYPVMVTSAKPQRVATQLLVFGGHDRLLPEALPKSIHVSESGRLDARAAATALGATERKPIQLIAFSVESGVGMTHSKHLAIDGTGMYVRSIPTTNGFEVTLYGLGNNSALELGHVVVARDEAAVIPVEISGQEFLAVVHSVAGGDRSFEDFLGAFHEPFMEAARGYPSLRLIGMQVTGGRSALDDSDQASEPLMSRSAWMLSVTQRVGYR